MSVKGYYRNRTKRKLGIYRVRLRNHFVYLLYVQDNGSTFNLDIHGIDILHLSGSGWLLIFASKFQNSVAFCISRCVTICFITVTFSSNKCIIIRLYTMASRHRLKGRHQEQKEKSHFFSPCDVNPQYSFCFIHFGCLFPLPPPLFFCQILKAISAIRAWWVLMMADSR